MRIRILIISSLCLLLISLAAATPQAGNAPAVSQCVDCHAKITPNIVSDWKQSRHSQNQVGCEACHGSEHTSAQDAAKAKIPTPDTCGSCHETQVAQFKKGKHSMAWAAMNAMPTIHWQPMALIEGMKGCGACHKIGLKSAAEIEGLRKQGNEFGVASCDSCHTRHTFSVEEARQPQACETCHMGFDHPQWEMYSSSKHGVRNELKQLKIQTETSAAPTCQTCHMQKGNHEVRTAWGFLAVRLPMPEDKQWAADRATILAGPGRARSRGQADAAARSGESGRRSPASPSRTGRPSATRC